MVSIIIINYNTTALTERCIRSVYQYCRKEDIEIIVVDNASPDRGIERLALIFPGVQLILNNSNIGFGRANNIGIEKARGEFLFLLNSDTELLSDAPAYFRRFMQDAANKNVAVCGAMLITGSEFLTPSFGNFPSLFYSFSRIGFSYCYQNYYRKHVDIGVANYDDNIKTVDFISGAGMFIRASVLRQVGNFDPAFFLYFEETELSWRIYKAGYRSVILPSVQILHLEGSSSAQQKKDTDTFNYFAYYHYTRSRTLFYKKAYGWWYIIIAWPLDTMGLLARTLVGKEKGHLCRKLAQSQPFGR